MEGLTRWVLSHRAVVALFWLFIAVAGAATAGRTVDSLSYDFGLPGQPAYEANTQIRETFGGGGVDDPIVLTVSSADGSLGGVEGRHEFSEVAERVASAAPGTLVVTSANSGPEGLVAVDGGQAVALLYPQVVDGPEPYAVALPAIEAAAEQADVFGEPVALTSTVLLAEGVAGAATAASWSRSASARVAHCWCWPWCSGRCWLVCPCS